MPTAVLDGQGFRKVKRQIAKGTIVGFYGARCPQGWAVCDGTNGTPDLSDRFIVGDTAVSIGAAGGTESAVSGLTHAGLAVGAHNNHVVTQPGGHGNHVVTPAGAHSNHAATQPVDHGTHAANATHTHDAHTTTASGSAAVIGTHLSGPGTHAANATHTHDAHSAHASFGVDAHSAHSGLAVDAHSAHSGMAVDAHSAHLVTQASNHLLKHLKLAWIMKL